MESWLYTIPVLGVGMIAAGVALGARPARCELGQVGIVKRADLPDSRRSRREPRAQADREPEPEATLEAEPAPAEPPTLEMPRITWHLRLDRAVADDDIPGRCMLAESLGAIHDAWAQAFLRDALDDEPEPRVRARLLGALIRGGHLEDPAVFAAALRAGGIECAAVLERLSLLAHKPVWAEALLEPPHGAEATEERLPNGRAQEHESL